MKKLLAFLLIIPICCYAFSPSSKALSPIPINVDGEVLTVSGSTISVKLNPPYNAIFGNCPLSGDAKQYKGNIKSRDKVRVRWIPYYAKNPSFYAIGTVPCKIIEVLSP